MKISEIQSGMMGIRLSAIVLSIGLPREIKTKFGTETKVANAKLEDESGAITLALWGEQIDTVKVGERISVEGAYAKEWNGELQLSIGKKGKIEVIQ